MKKIILPLFAAIFAFTSCNWNDVKNLDYTQNHLSPEESDPEGYAVYLESLREYKESDHNVMIAGFETIEGDPVLQSQRISSLPDSVDFVWLRDIHTMSPVLLEEMSDARTRKGMKFLADVNFDTISKNWNDLQSEKAANGQQPASDEEFKTYVKEQTSLQLAKCDEYGLDGILFTANGSSTPAQETFIKTIKDAHASHAYNYFVFRGGIKNIKDYTVLEDCDYLIVIGNDQTVTVTDINARVGVMIGFEDQINTDKILYEVTVPDSENPDQVGATADVAAKWVLKYMDSSDYIPRGIVVRNVEDDYYGSELIYHNVRQAISIMNEVEVQE